VTLSLWRGDECVATHQMAADDVSKLIGLLAESMTALIDIGLDGAGLTDAAGL
jgi:hypothetical protein